MPRSGQRNTDNALSVLAVPVSAVTFGARQFLRILQIILISVLATMGFIMTSGIAFFSMLFPSRRRRIYRKAMPKSGWQPRSNNLNYDIDQLLNGSSAIKFIDLNKK